MDAINNIQRRVSFPKLTEPGPGEEQIRQMIASALRAPDHGVLTPWRFILLEGDARGRYGEALAEIKARDGGSDAECEKARRSALRAPAVLVVVASIKPGRIPAIEQEYSAAAAAQNILLTAHALGVGAMWRTGWPIFHPEVNLLLGLTEQEKIVAFIYLGTPDIPRKELPRRDPEAFLSTWGN